MQVNKVRLINLLFRDSSDVIEDHHAGGMRPYHLLITFVPVVC